MTNVADALLLARQGFHVFPLRPGSKLPAIEKFPERATRNPDRIQRWADKYPDANWGISTSKFGDDEALIVVDIDTKPERFGKKAKHGNRSVVALELAGFDFPITMECATPSGGRHLVYRHPVPVRQGSNVLAEDIDIRSKGGYIVAPGSITVEDEGAATFGGEYFVDRPDRPQPAPEWIVAKCGPARERTSGRKALDGINADRARMRALAYLQHEAPEAIEGAGGDFTTFKVAARLKDLGVTPEVATDLMLSEWHEGCGWSPDELATKVRNAYKYGENPPGYDAPEAQFEPVEDDEAPAATKKGHPFDELNKEFAFVMTGGGHHILWETTDFKGNAIVEHVKEGSFHKLLAAKDIQIGKKTEKLTEAWIACARRRTYNGLIFAPERDVDGRWYNLWRGFDYAPKATASPRATAAVQSWFDHVERNICRGNKALAQWFVGYMAHLVQRPWEKPLVALVLKGKKGTGKNAVIERVGALFSRSMVVADDDRYLIGNFNSHLEACLMLALDEASWAGSKKVEGKLKGVITGSKHMIERKGIEPYQVDNLTRVVILGNEDWLVPATQDERRYAVFDVGEADMQRRGFFQEMREGMEANGGEGYSLLLSRLQSFDLSAVDVNAAPSTDGLADQKLESLGPQHQWWLDCLIEGQILGGDFAGEWPERMATNRLQDAAKRHSHGRGIRTWAPTATQFNRSMAFVLPGWKHVKSGKTQPGDATYHYELPTLAEARAAMAKYVGKPDLFPSEDES